MLLVIQSFGAKLSVSEGLFEVTTVQQNQYTKQTYATPEVNSIWIQHGCSITTAAIHLAAEHDIDLLLLNHFGLPTGRFMPIRPNSIVSIQRAQIVAAEQKLGFEIIQEWIAQKMLNQMTLLGEITKHHFSTKKDCPEIAKAIEQISRYRVSLLALEAENTATVAATIRGLEGSAGRAYFGALTVLIPERYNFEKRTYQKSDDFFNTCLNYAYAILYSRVESALSKAGLNPYAGFLHRDEYQHLSMVYDFVEPYRAWVDEKIFSLIASKSMTKSCFEHNETSDALWLSREGKKQVSDLIITMLKDKISDDTLTQVNKEYFLVVQAQKFATKLRAKARIIALNETTEAETKLPIAA
jgi:CRISP-associated protein Cas1